MYIYIINYIFPIDNNFGNEGARSLKRLFKHITQIENINLSGNGITDEPLNEVCQSIRPLLKLQTLNVSRNKIGFGGLGLLNAVLGKLQNFKSLDVSSNTCGCGFKKAMTSCTVNYYA